MSVHPRPKPQRQLKRIEHMAKRRRTAQKTEARAPINHPGVIKPGVPEPMLDRVVVRMREAQPFYDSGNLLVTPDVWKPKGQEADVLAVGPGKRLLGTGGHIPIPLEVGDHVLLGKFAGTEIELERDCNYIIVKEDEIVAVITRGNPEKWKAGT